MVIRRPYSYFMAAQPSVDRRLRSIPLPTGAGITASEPHDLTAAAGYYATSMSPLGGYYALNYAGPGLPWVRLFKADEPGAPRGLRQHCWLSLGQTLAYRCLTTLRSIALYRPTLCRSAG
jgi:hypothetical protein